MCVSVLTYKMYNIEMGSQPQLLPLKWVHYHRGNKWQVACRVQQDFTLGDFHILNISKNLSCAFFMDF